MRTGIQLRLIFDHEEKLTWDEVLPFFEIYGSYWSHNRELIWMETVWRALGNYGFTHYDHVSRPISVMWHATALCWIYHTFNYLYDDIRENMEEWEPGEMFASVDACQLTKTDIYRLNNVSINHATLKGSLHIIYTCLNQHNRSDDKYNSIDFSIFEGLAAIRYSDGEIELKDYDLSLFDLFIKMKNPDLYEGMLNEKIGRILYWIECGFGEIY